MPPAEEREEEYKSSKYSPLPIEGFLSLCDLVMNLSSHQIIVSWKERSSSDMPVNLILIFFSSSSKYLIWSVNLRSVLICYTTLTGNVTFIFDHGMVSSPFTDPKHFWIAWFKGNQSVIKNHEQDNCVGDYTWLLTDARHSQQSSKIFSTLPVIDSLLWVAEHWVFSQQ